MKLNIFALSFVLVGMAVLAARAEPEPKGRLVVNPKFRAAAEFRQAANVENVEAEDNDDAVEDKVPAKADASTGRLFLKKFLLFGKQQQQQPIIPIIITGGAATATSVSPTQTITSTGSIPSATGLITTSPTTADTTDTETPVLRSGTGYNSQDDGEGEEEESLDGIANDGVAVADIDEEALQSALIAGAQEYVVTDEEIKGTSDSKAQQQNRVNLRRKGGKNGKKGQRISVRIPPQYRRYFKAGQKVMLNAGNNRPVKRRVVKKRVNKNRNRKRFNKNKRNRIIAA